MKRGTKRREKQGRERGEKRREGKKRGEEANYYENEDLPPAAALAALRVLDSSASEWPDALTSDGATDVKSVRYSPSTAVSFQKHLFQEVSTQGASLPNIKNAQNSAFISARKPCRMA